MVCQAESWGAPYCAFSCGMPADGGRIEEDGGALEGGEPRPLRVPLVPADEGADAAVPRVERSEADVSRSEVELLVEAGIVGDVHLAVEARDLAVGVEGDRAVVVKAGGPLLEERDDHRDSVLLRGRAQGLGAGAGHGLREVEARVLFLLAEVGGTIELGQANDLRALGGRFPDPLDGLVQVGRWVLGHLHLDEAHRELRCLGHHWGFYETSRLTARWRAWR